MSTPDQNAIDQFVAAAANCQLPVLQRLYTQHGAAILDQRNSNGETALTAAVRVWHTQAVFNFLIKAGADKNHPDANGHTPLMKAVKQRQNACLSALLSGGAAITAQDNLGWTALHHAAATGFAECIPLLVAHDMPINILNHKQQTPLFMAAIQGHSRAIEILLAMGANLYHMDKDGHTAADCAAIFERSGMARKLYQLMEEGQQRAQPAGEATTEPPPLP